MGVCPGKEGTPRRSLIAEAVEAHRGGLFSRVGYLVEWFSPEFRACVGFGVSLTGKKETYYFPSLSDFPRWNSVDLVCSLLGVSGSAN